EMGGERMSQPVRMDPRGDPGRARVTTEDLPEPHAAQGTALRIDEHRVVPEPGGAAAAPAGISHERRSAVLQVVAQRALGGAPERNFPLLVPLAGHPQQTPGQVDPGALEAAELR